MNSPYTNGCTQVCNQGRDCTCVMQECQSAAPEGGNVWLQVPGTQTLPTSRPLGVYIGMSIALLINFTILAAACGWAYETFFN